MLRIFYGSGRNFIDVTEDALEKCCDGERIYIPSGDTGATFFPDPLHGHVKTIIVFQHEHDSLTCKEFYRGEEIQIHLSDEDIKHLGIDVASDSTTQHSRRIAPPPPGLDTDDRINFYHSQLKCTGGDVTHEWREQSMVVNHLDPAAKVLELGSNIGRNTLMISCVLDDERNLVTLECNPFFVELLRNNRFANHFQFHIEPSALSYRKLIQSKDQLRYGTEAEAWEALPSEDLPEGYEWVSTITFDQLKDKYRLDFDTLVADCEGALFYILDDSTEMLENIRTIILESDYRLAEHKWAVEATFKDFGFEKVHAEALYPNLTDLPDACANSFWEVWKRGG